MTDLSLSKTSMLYWWPRIKNLGIPVPRTEIVEIPYTYLVSILDGKPLPKEYLVMAEEAGRKIGYPIFLRTDMASAKHQWDRTCFVPTEDKLFKHIWTLVDETLTTGMFGELDPNALVFRELLELTSPFTAFSGLPISCERRYFIRNGKVECHHPYWPESAIERSWIPPSEPRWRELLASLNIELPWEIELLTNYASRVGTVLDGYWSIDFSEGQKSTWYLIDMAEGDKSWHPKH